MKSGMFKLMAVLALLGGLSLTTHEAMAVANGNGICEAGETAAFECANFGGNIVEFMGTVASSTCYQDAAPAAPCTAYFYKYTGSATNQLNAALPTRVNKTFNSATEVNCSQLLTGGTGDPTTGFGKNQKTLNICRLALNVSTLNAAIPAPPGSSFGLYADPSTFDNSNPLDWQLKQGNSVYGASLVGPFSSQVEIQETAVTLATPAGGTVSYTNSGGNIQITSPLGRLVQRDGTKLCIVNPGGNKNVPYTDPTFKNNWTCETITYATEQCDIKTSGSDPCRFIGGYCIQY